MFHSSSLRYPFPHMRESACKAVECTKHHLATGDTEFMTFSPSDFVEDVAIDGRAFRVSVKSYIVRIEKLSSPLVLHSALIVA